MLRNTDDGYGLVAIILHWLIALLIVGQLIVGLVMVRLDDQRLAFELIQWHKSFGFLTLVLVAVRIGWRLVGRSPRPLAATRLERIAARLGHAGLYALMVALPLTGWALVSSSELAIPTFAFYLVIVPHLPIERSFAAESRWSEIHEILAWVLVGLVAIHVAAAIRHHFRLGDATLARMLRPVRRRLDRRSRQS